MSGTHMVTTSIPAKTLEWCPSCGGDLMIDSFLVSRCPTCGQSLLPCSTCMGCKINETYNVCARFGLSLDNQSEELEKLLDATYLRNKCLEIEINFLLDPEIYLDLFTASMLVDLRLRGLNIDSIQIFCDSNRCAMNSISSKIKLRMDSIHAEFPAIPLEQLVCLAYWETFCTLRHRSLLNVLKNTDKT